MQEVNIILKNPSGEDFSLRVPLSTSISDLKRKIATEHPEKPAFDRQRLIFAGRLLNDNELLSHVLRPDQNDLNLPQKFHLVIRRDQTGQTTRNNVPPQQPGNQAQWGGYPGNFGQQFQNPYYQPPYNMPQQGVPYNIPPQQGVPYNIPPQGQWGYPGNMPQQPFYQPQYPGMGAGGPFVQPVHFQRVGFARINIDFGLIFKLILLVYVLSQGGGSERMAILMALAIAYYLYQTGMARFQFVRFGAPNGQQPQQAPAQPLQQQNQQPQQPQQQGQVPPVPQAQGADREPAQGAHEGRNENMYHQQGVVGEILGFFVPLVCSLFPSWQPPENTRPPVAQQPVPPPRAREGGEGDLPAN